MEDKFTSQEEQLRSLSEEYTLDIDTTELWSNIESKLPPVEHKRRPLLWWWIGSASIFVLAILGWVLVSEDSSLSEETIPNTTEISSNVIKEESIKKQETNSEKTPIASANLVPIVSEKVNTQRTIQQSTKTNHKNQSQKINREATQNTLNQNDTSEINYESYDEKSTVRKTEEINQSNPKTDSPESALIDPSDSRLVIVPTELVEQKRKVETQLALIQTIIPGPIYNEMDVILPKEIKPLKKIYWLPFAAISSGVNSHITDVTINGTEPSGNTSLEKEQALLGMSTSVRYGYESSNGWRFSGGLSHSRLVNRYQQLETVVSTQQVGGVATTKINSQGASLDISGTLLETTITQYDRKIHRTHDFVDLQIFVGKQLFKINRFGMSLDVGVAGNLASFHQGYYFEGEDQRLINFELGEENPYANSNFSALANVSLEYRLDKIAIQLMPFAAKGLNSYTKSTHLYQLKNSQYGIQLGIVYRP